MMRDDVPSAPGPTGRGTLPMPVCQCWLAQQCDARRGVIGHPSHSGSTDHVGLVDRQSATHVQGFPSEPCLFIEHPAGTAGQASSGTSACHPSRGTLPGRYATMLHSSFIGARVAEDLLRHPILLGCAMSTETPSTTHVKTPKNLVITFVFLGITTGVYVGWSKSPVVDTLVAGVFGILSAIALFLLGIEKKSRLSFSTSQIEDVFRGLCVFCVLCVTGTLIGIWLRIGRFPLRATSAPDDLILIGDGSRAISSVDHYKLIVVQNSLSRLRISNEENNSLLRKLITSRDRSMVDPIPQTQDLDTILLEVLKVATQTSQSESDAGSAPAPAPAPEPPPV